MINRKGMIAMSGGSFNYLCFKDASELFNYIEEIEAMAAELNELGFHDAEKDTLKVKNIILQSIEEVQGMKDRLNDVWAAVEWYVSGDSGLDNVKKAIDLYKK